MCPSAFHIWEYVLGMASNGDDKEISLNMQVRRNSIYYIFLSTFLQFYLVRRWSQTVCVCVVSCISCSWLPVKWWLFRCLFEFLFLSFPGLPKDLGFIVMAPQSSLTETQACHTVNRPHLYPDVDERRLEDFGSWFNFRNVEDWWSRQNYFRFTIRGTEILLVCCTWSWCKRCLCRMCSRYV